MNLKPIHILVFAALAVLIHAAAIPQPESAKDMQRQRDDPRDIQGAASKKGATMIKSMEQLKEILAGRTFTLPKSLGNVGDTIEIELKPAAPKNHTGLMNADNSNNDFSTGANHRCLSRGQTLWDGESITAYDPDAGSYLVFYMRVRSDYLAVSEIDYNYMRNSDIWTVGQGSGTSDSHLSYQNDGNVCYYHENSPNPGWCSNTYGRNDMYLMCLDAFNGRLLMGSLYVPPVLNGGPVPVYWMTRWSNY
ncbi:hypothetical protein BCR33DRAFT_713787 [Rhizoclosmatium globosum]|uniref:Bulb-type lectin domain-containing protein n=1 Tax=Rhizoclosmatium globosum TaxID=329046 RepID=A0A1Y2CSX7_9FUNG|nr:hypothetical protein BCR33DRAFT_713787 [Rhizoclosmatium globosum]|eukprot:ORY49475.1 hypothetical protein BCR33DRAFT_713787 [Rhizoclosmatium globosum]